jgi:hypothetical protein
MNNSHKIHLDSHNLELIFKFHFSLKGIEYIEEFNHNFCKDYLHILYKINKKRINKKTIQKINSKNIKKKINFCLN